VRDYSGWDLSQGPDFRGADWYGSQIVCVLKCAHIDGWRGRGTSLPVALSSERSVARGNVNRLVIYSPSIMPR
jgi:hypothetical protein